MPIIARSDANFEKAPTGNQQAVCAFIHDIGTQVGEYKGEPTVRHQVIISWELAETMTQGENAGKPFMVSKYYTLSLNEKATLRKDLESWRGKAFTEDELREFDLERLIGANCFLNITATESDKRKIAAIAPMPKNIAPIKAVQTAPSEKFREWIDRERAKSLEARGETQKPAGHIDNGGKADDLPF